MFVPVLTFTSPLGSGETVSESFSVLTSLLVLCGIALHRRSGRAAVIQAVADLPLVAGELKEQSKMLRLHILVFHQHAIGIFESW